jgi:hypothetical protein
MGRTKLSGVTPEKNRIKNRDETAIRDKFSPESA